MGTIGNAPIHVRVPTGAPAACQASPQGARAEPGEVAALGAGDTQHLPKKKKKPLLP